MTSLCGRIFLSEISSHYNLAATWYHSSENPIYLKFFCGYYYLSKSPKSCEWPNWCQVSVHQYDTKSWDLASWTCPKTFGSWSRKSDTWARKRVTQKERSQLQQTDVFLGFKVKKFDKINSNWSTLLKHFKGGKEG